MLPVPQLDWPKDLYASPWKDIEGHTPEHSLERAATNHWRMRKLLVVCVTAPFLTAASVFLKRVGTH
jgi:hypothetical protein